MNLNLSGMAFLIPVVIIIVLAWIGMHAAAIALMLTGMDRRKASFEALSAFFGVGFTTRYSEEIVSHPQRRRIISIMIILGNAGIITVIASLVGTVASSSINKSLATVPIGLIVGAVVIFVLWRIAAWRGWTEKFEKWVESKLLSWKVFKEKRVIGIIEVDGDYVVGKVLAREDTAFTNRKLGELNLTKKGVLVLAINRSGRIIRPPKASNFIREGDILTVFGKRRQIERTF
ncbi:hypothetical protein GF359_02195 [candidate division WOR-3 bacterium]|uniref:RCK C-terminal domain-containing protein n=1 Tax=candidate division WOR-3 bacterium TaxID=2052148 RepID=A0A9D5QC02_UNCW3|nr:hypothetical protein [candidate division WOR-3 bacterium]MBD3364004.1 hypothetical protein [candidate division WOR-3 bacterium]